MAEKITRLSAGVTFNEIDLSAVSAPDQSPRGIPAGVIGRSKFGPAFVPVTLSSYSLFTDLFGSADAEQAGPLAVREWLRSAQAATFIRVLGVGDGKQRAGDGTVANAGFIVGDQIIQTENIAGGGTAGTYGKNTYANENGNLGRMHFLGTFMSESKGSTVFSDAGIQKTAAPTKASKTTTVDLVFNTNPLGAGAGGDAFTVTVPKAAGGTGDAITIKFNTNGNMPSAAANTIAIRQNVSATTAEDICKLVELAFAGTNPNGVLLPGGSTAVAAEIVFANSGDGQLGTGVSGVTATAVGTKIIFEAVNAVAAGNDIALVDTAADFIETAFGTAGTIKLTGGSNDNHAVPIIRGIVMAPSGVLPLLKCNN